MKKLGVILIIALFFSMSRAQEIDNKNFNDKFQHYFWRKNDQWLAKDKLKHLTTSMFIYVTSYYHFSRYSNRTVDIMRINSYTITYSFGLGKEILDLKGNEKYFSLKDLAVDLVGGLAGNIFINQIK